LHAEIWVQSRKVVDEGELKPVIWVLGRKFVTPVWVAEEFEDDVAILEVVAVLEEVGYVGGEFREGEAEVDGAVLLGFLEGVMFWPTDDTYGFPLVHVCRITVSDTVCETGGFRHLERLKFVSASLGTG
jgi:hypothetical protein